MKPFLAICLIVSTALLLCGIAPPQAVVVKHKSSAAAPTKVQVTPTTCTAFNTTLNCVFGSNVTSGNDILVAVRWGLDTDTVSLTVCGGSPTSVVGPTGFVGQGAAMQVWKYHVTSTAACTITPTKSGGNSRLSVVAVEFTAGTVDQNSVIANQLVPGTGTDAITTATITPTVANSYAVTFVDNASQSSATFTAGTNWAKQLAVTSDMLMLEARTLSSTSAVAGTATWGSGTGSTQAVVVNVKP
jgi:hypothetical protein